MNGIQFLRGRAFVLAYAAMPDHVHLLLVPKEGHTISDVMKSLKGFTARIINVRLAQRGALWQQSFYDRIVRSDEQLWQTIEYIHHNPVAADLVERAEDYSFSSAGRESTVDLEDYFRE